MVHHRVPRRRVRHWLAAALLTPALAAGGVLALTASDPPVAAVASAASPQPDTAPATASATVPAAADPVAVDVSAVLGAVDAAASAAGGSIAVVVLDGDGAELVAGSGADDPLPTASLVKLLVVQQLLARDEAGELSLDDDDLALMRRAVTASDDDAMSTLWTRFDGADLVTAAAAEFGLTGTAPPETAGQWGESTTTAADYATFLAGLQDALSPADLATLIGWMQATTATAADGFDQQFGLLSTDARATGAVAAKQGWMCCVDGHRQLHSAAVLADGRVVVLLGDFPTSTTWAAAREALDAAATAVVSGT
ncbi:serine hydrolase [Modestobacter italicus]|uniref:serine hydrolase n=1 Tax=Modestobacter italicus (strain DSM 44449 / CECT 9708 / BC 501) TaxID=2732864 RepID=UPI001C986A67|nr:serine hydrolase [Modestobacter italicus]